MKQEIKRKIALKEAVSKEILDADTELKSLRDQLQQAQSIFNAKNEALKRFVTGICLQEGVNPLKEGVFFSEDYKEINIYSLEEVKEESAKKSHVKKSPVKHEKVK